LPLPLFCADIPDEKATVAVPVAIREDRMWDNLRSWLAREYRLQITAGGFDKDFAELNKVTSAYAELPLDKATTILDAEVQRSGERVQVIGLTLPLRTLSLTAAGIIVLVQLYMLLHLQQFPLLASVTERIAWMPVYDNLWARLTTIMTGALLPVATCIYAMVTHSSWWNVATLIVSVIVAVRSGPLFWQLPRLYDRTTSGGAKGTVES
jgi:hypothetical protein